MEVSKFADVFNERGQNLALDALKKISCCNMDFSI